MACEFALGYPWMVDSFSSGDRLLVSHLSHFMYFVYFLLGQDFSSCSGWRPSSLRCMGFSLQWPLLPQSTGSRCMGLTVAANTLRCSAAYGISVPGPGIKPMYSALASRFLTTGHQILNHWTPSFVSFCVLRTWLGNCQVGIPQNMAKQKHGLYPICSQLGPYQLLSILRGVVLLSFNYTGAWHWVLGWQYPWSPLWGWLLLSQCCSILTKIPTVCSGQNLLRFLEETALSSSKDKDLPDWKLILRVR